MLVDSHPKTFLRTLRVQHIVLAAAAAAALLLLYRAPSLWLWNAWRTDPYYEHGVLVAALALGLTIWRLRKSTGSTAVPAWCALGIPFAAGVYLYGLRTGSAHLMVWSIPLLAAAVALATGGVPRLRLLTAPLLLLALAIPTPWTLELGLALQRLATGASVAALGAVGVPLESSVYGFSVGDLAFEVTAACSGFQSAISLLAVAAVVVAVVPTPPRRAALVLGAAVPVALALNVARILAVVGVGLGWGTAAAEGFFHGGSSAILFLAETLVVLALAGLLKRPNRGVAAPA